MALEINCCDCGRQISVDEAFAGGMCRCPHCKATVLVPADSDSTARQQPEAPPVSRPEVPGQPPAVSDPSNPAAAAARRRTKLRNVITIMVAVAATSLAVIAVIHLLRK